MAAINLYGLDQLPSLKLEKWTQITQETCNMKIDLRLGKDEDGLLDYTPMFIPRDSALARRIIEHCHVQTLHGGVAATMSKVRQRYWLPRLRSMVKSVRRGCNYCKKYRETVLNAPPTLALPKFRTQFTEPFNVTGIDFAGPLQHRSGSGTGKVFAALFTCASTRAVHFKLCRDMTAEESKRGLSSHKGIGWKFKMTRAPWWGGFFKKLISIMKNVLSKAVGRALLRLEEVEEVLFFEQPTPLLHERRI